MLEKDIITVSSNGFISLLDIHFGKKCNIRLDNTDDIILKKLNEILCFCNENQIKVITIAGDIFDNCSIDRKTFMKAIKIFRKFKSADIKVFGIYGNHDEYRYNQDYRKETPLYDLEELGLITLLDSSKQLTVKCYDEFNEHENNNIHYFKIFAFPYLENNKLKEFKYNGTSEKTKSIVIGHCFYENEFMGGKEDNITKKDIEKLNVDFVILGHDHSEYKDVILEEINTTVIRNGSLVRGTSSANDLQRTPNFYWFKPDDLIIQKVKLECEKLKDIITAKATVKEKQINFDDIIEEIKFSETNTETDLVMEAINKLENDKIKTIIRRNINEI